MRDRACYTGPMEKDHGMKGAFSSPVTRMRKAMLRNVGLPVLRPEMDRLTLERLFEAHPAPDLAIRHLLKDGSLIRVRRGLYAGNTLFQVRPWDPGMLASLMVKESCVSGETALWMHGMARRPSGCTCTCPGKTRTLETSLGPYRFQHLAAASWGFGQHLRRLGDGSSHLMADPEKALVDGIRMRKGIRSRKQLKALVLDEMGILPESLVRFDLPRLRIYGRRCGSALVGKVLVPWLESLVPGVSKGPTGTPPGTSGS